MKGLLSKDNLSSGASAVSSFIIALLFLMTSFIAARPLQVDAMTSVETPRVIFKLGDTPAAVSALALADTDGDGTKDFVLGSIGSGDFIASTYIVFNKPNLPAVVNLDSLGSFGYKITTSELSFFGTSAIGQDIENVGDINGDNKDDLLISTVVPKVSGIQYAYLLYGKSDNSDIDVNNLLLSEGTRFKAQVTVNNLYLALAGVGDVNGDNLDDFIFGDFTKNLVGEGTDGQVHVVLGRTFWPAELDLNNLSGADGFQINGKIQSQTGYAVSAAGDVNGDGYNDMLFTSPQDGIALGITRAVYVVFGKQNPQNVSLASLSDQGIRMFSETQRIALNGAVEGLGDVNEDGFDDIAIRIEPSFSSPNDAPVITVFGRATAGEINLDTLGTEGSLLTAESDDVSFPVALARSDSDLFVSSHTSPSLEGDDAAGVVYGVPLSSLSSSQVLPNPTSFAVRGAESQIYLGGIIADGSVNGELLVSVGSGTSNIVAAVVPARDANIVLTSPEPETINLSPIADTYIRSGQPNRNHGSDTEMQLRSSGDNRTLLRFDQDALEGSIGNGTILSAKLRLIIADNGNNWGSTGRTVDLYRMLTDWVEGNGTQNDRGTGSGVTWSCAIDSNVANQAKNCSGDTEWEMGQPNNPSVHPWVQAVTATQTIINNQTGIVEFDVTGDLVSFMTGTDNYGWLLKKTNENQNGQVSFGTRESQLVPQLIVTYQP